MQLKWWDITDQAGLIPLGSSVPALARDPFDSSRIIYVNNGSMPHPAMRTTLPWDGVTQVKPTVWYDSRPPGSYPKSLQSHVGADGKKRAVFAQITTSTTVDDLIYEIDDDGAGPTLFGPLKCGEMTLCKQPFKTSDAVPDPTGAKRVLATCDTATNYLRNVVRIDASSCTLVVDGSALPNLTYPNALGVGAPR
jgi:hypothetical protein